MGLVAFIVSKRWGFLSLLQNNRSERISKLIEVKEYERCKIIEINEYQYLGKEKFRRKPSARAGGSVIPKIIPLRFGFRCICSVRAILSNEASSTMQSRLKEILFDSCMRAVEDQLRTAWLRRHYDPWLQPS